MCHSAKKARLRGYMDMMDTARRIINQNSSTYTMTGETQIVVALLVSDLKVAKKLSEVYKTMGVSPYVCTSLSEFWQETLKEMPHMAVVDVKMMNQGDYLLKDHPMVISEELPLAFYYDETSSALLYSAYDTLNFGFIDGRLSLKGQLKAVLKRYNTFNSWQDRAKDALLAEENLDSKLAKIVKKTEELKEKTFYQALQKSIQGRLELEKEADDFQSAIARVFAPIKEFRSFTFLELSPSKQKLVSPKFQYDKYVEIPSLWLGRTCGNGIEFFAQNMASQICLELMGGELMSLIIRGKSREPDMMIFIRVEGEEFLAQFDWESLERYLSGLYSYFALRGTTENDQAKLNGQTWDLFSLLDDIKYGALPESRVEGGYERFALIGIDFKELVDRALAQEGMRFYWKRFFSDFLNGLDVQKGINARNYHYDLRHTFLLVDKEEVEHTLSEIKNYCLRYPFWRYFEDADVVLGASLKPEVRIIPMSPQAITMIATEDDQVKKLESTFEEKPKKAKRKGFYHPGNEQNM